jgi:hypothetical protein
MLYADSRVIVQVREQFVNMTIVAEATKARLESAMFRSSLNRSVDEEPACVAGSVSDFGEY